MDMYAFIDELEARFDEARSCDLQELIDELTDAERASVTLSARLAGVEGVVTLALRGGGVIVGEVLDSTSTWVLLRASTGDSLVMISAVVGAWPLGIEVAIDSDCGDHRGVIDAVYGDHIDVALSEAALGYDGRDEQEGQIMSLALSGLRRLRVLGQRWSPDY